RGRRRGSDPSRHRHHARKGCLDCREAVTSGWAAATSPSEWRRPFFGLAAGYCPDPVRIKPPDRLLGAVGEPRDPPTRGVAREACYEILAHDRRPVEPDEKLRIQPLLESGHGMVDEPAAPSDVEPHVITLGRHPIDVSRGNPNQAREVRGPEFVEPLRTLARNRVCAALLQIGMGTVERAL